jgi:type IV secretory pathway VirB2 component (pilin)
MHSWILMSIALASVNPPEACKLLILSDVTAALGAGYALGPAFSLANTSEMSSCLYQHGRGNSVAISILAAPGGDAKSAVGARAAGQKAFGRTVTTLTGVCDAAFVVVITPANTTLISGKGSWQIEYQVVTGGKPDPEAEQRFAKIVCSKLT